MGDIRAVDAATASRDVDAEIEGAAISSPNPIVDVGIPTLGARPFLTEAVESVFAQTLSAWRLVISENGPGVESVRRALEPYIGDPRVRHVVTGQKVSLASNYNNLFRDANAPYLGMLHDDDRWHPQFLERRVDFLEEHRACGFVYSGYVVMDESGRPLGRKRLKPRPGVHSSASILPKLCRSNFIGVVTVLIRRSAYERVGAAYKDILFNDHEMWLRLACQFDVGCIGVWDADYRIHADQLSASRSSLADAEFPALASFEDLPLPRRSRRLMHAEAHARRALDAVERGERRQSLEHLARAVRIDPLAIARPVQAARMLAVIGALVGGERARRAVTARRDRFWRDAGSNKLLKLLEDDDVS